MIFLFSPFIGEFVYVCVNRNLLAPWSSLLVFPAKDDVDWGLYISTLVWSNGGFDLLGSMVGDVKEQRYFLYGIIGAIPLGFINYIFPIILCYLVFPQWKNWNSSMFAYIATHFFPNWISVWMVAATVISNFGPFNAVTAPLARSVWAMAVGRDGGLGEHRYLPYFMSWSIKKPNGEMVPIVPIIICCLIPFCIALFSLAYIFQVYLLVRLFTLFFEYFSLIYLKYKEPDTHRPFRIPGGVWGAVLLFLPTFGIAIFALIHAAKVPIIAGVVAISSIILSYGIKLGWVWATHKWDCCLYRRTLTKNNTTIQL